MFFITTQSISRKEAVRRINSLAGKDLRAMADEYKIPVWKNGRQEQRLGRAGDRALPWPAGKFTPGTGLW